MSTIRVLSGCSVSRAPSVHLFHGDRDQSVPPEESQRLSAAIREAGGEAKLTLYPDTGHDCWTKAFADAALYEWFLSKRLPPPQR